MKRLIPFTLFALVLLAACGDDQREPTGPVPFGPNLAISDGAHNAGDPDFFFGPPLTAEAQAAGLAIYKDKPANMTLSPFVVICKLAITGIDPSGNPINPTCSTPVFQQGVTGSGLGPTTIDGEYYKVLWDTDVSNLTTGDFYRIQVFLPSTAPASFNQQPSLLGYVDVRPVSGSSVKNVTTGEIVGLVDGRTLPIRFRIEHPTADVLVVRVDDDGGTFTTGHAGIRLPPGWLSDNGANPGIENVLLIITRSPVTTVGTNQNVCDPAFPNAFLAEYEGCFKFDMFPEVTFARPVTVGVCPEFPFTDPRLDDALLHKSEGAAEPPVALEQVFTENEFIECEGFTGQTLGMSSNPVIQLASAGLRKLGAGLGRVFGPTPLFALDAGGYGRIDIGGGLSFIRPAVSATLLIEQGNGQTAAPGAYLPSNPGVNVVTTHEDEPVILSTHDLVTTHDFVDDAVVTFTVTGGGGCVEPAIVGPVVCGTSTTAIAVEGFAQVRWRLGTTPGANTLQATTPGALAPANFSATGAPLSTLFEARFNSNTANVLPGAPEAGTWSLDETDGTIRVRQPVFDGDTPPFLDKWVEMTTFGEAAGTPLMHGVVAGTAPLTGTWVAKWRSAVTAGGTGTAVRVSLHDAANRFVVASVGFSVNAGNNIVYGNNTVVGAWTPNIYQSFEIVVDLTAKKTTLKINGVAVAAATNVDFFETSASGLGSIVMSFGGMLPQTFIMDDIYIGVPITPPPGPS